MSSSDKRLEDDLTDKAEWETQCNGSKFLGREVN